MPKRESHAGANSPLDEKKRKIIGQSVVMKIYEEELLQKAWKDAAYGAALSIAPGSDEIEKMLSDAGVAESPLGRVSKQNPDRTISSEGRPITDMRRQNEAGSKFNHPPAPQPRHHAVARQSLWWKARRPASRRCATGF